MLPSLLDSQSAAVFSNDRRFRFSLRRFWGPGPSAHFCLLNPSTADEVENDPTLRRCIGFAKQWGCSSVIVTNLFPLVATDPKELLGADDRSGPPADKMGHYENDYHIIRAAQESVVTIVGWGTNAGRKPLSNAVPRMFHGVLKPFKPKALRVTKLGHPEHPLYLPYTCSPKEWTP